MATTARDRQKAVEFYHKMWPGAVQNWIDTGADRDLVDDDVSDLADLLASVREEAINETRCSCGRKRRVTDRAAEPDHPCTEDSKEAPHYRQRP